MSEFLIDSDSEEFEDPAFFFDDSSDSESEFEIESYHSLHEIEKQLSRDGDEFLHLLKKNFSQRLVITDYSDKKLCHSQMEIIFTDVWINFRNSFKKVLNVDLNECLNIHDYWRWSENWLNIEWKIWKLRGKKSRGKKNSFNSRYDKVNNANKFIIEPLIDYVGNSNPKLKEEIGRARILQNFLFSLLPKLQQLGLNRLQYGFSSLFSYQFDLRWASKDSPRASHRPTRPSSERRKLKNENYSVLTHVAYSPEGMRKWLGNYNILFVKYQRLEAEAFDAMLLCFDEKNSITTTNEFANDRGGKYFSESSDLWNLIYLTRNQLLEAWKSLKRINDPEMKAEMTEEFDELVNEYSSAVGVDYLTVFRLTVMNERITKGCQWKELWRTGIMNIARQKHLPLNQRLTGPKMDFRIKIAEKILELFDNHYSCPYEYDRDIKKRSIKEILRMLVHHHHARSRN